MAEKLLRKDTDLVVWYKMTSLEIGSYWELTIGGSNAGHLDDPPPPPDQFLSFSCFFRQKLWQVVIGIFATADHANLRCNWTLTRITCTCVLNHCMILVNSEFDMPNVPVLFIFIYYKKVATARIWSGMYLWAPLSSDQSFCWIQLL